MKTLHLAAVVLCCVALSACDSVESKPGPQPQRNSMGVMIEFFWTRNAPNHATTSEVTKPVTPPIPLEEVTTVLKNNVTTPIPVPATLTMPCDNTVELDCKKNGFSEDPDHHNVYHRTESWEGVDGSFSYTFQCPEGTVFTLAECACS